jgi:hypothetical protein
MISEHLVLLLLLGAVAAPQPPAQQRPVPPQNRSLEKPVPPDRNSPEAIARTAPAPRARAGTAVLQVSVQQTAGQQTAQPAAISRPSPPALRR